MRWLVLFLLVPGCSTEGLPIADPLAAQTSDAGCSCPACAPYPCSAACEPVIVEGFDGALGQPALCHACLAKQCDLLR